jgi:hypothetical protein
MTQYEIEVGLTMGESAIVVCSADAKNLIAVTLLTVGLPVEFQYGEARAYPGTVKLEDAVLTGEPRAQALRYLDAHHKFRLADAMEDAEAEFLQSGADQAADHRIDSYYRAA